MAKQDRSVWFDSINHLPLKPISSTTEQLSEEQPTPNLAKVQASESKESQKEVLPIEHSNNKHLSEGKSLSKEAVINKDTPIPSTKAKKVVKKAAAISKQSAQQAIVSPNDISVDSGSSNTDLSDRASIVEEEIFPSTEDVLIVDKQLDDHQIDSLSKETPSEKIASTDSIQKTGSTRRKRSTKNSAHRKSTPRKRSKNQTSSDKEKYITSRMFKDTYKEMISEYPLMNRTELVDSIIKFFFKHPKRQRDQWLNEQCGGLDKY